MQERNQSMCKTEVLIIGGGAGGCGVALKYAESMVGTSKPLERTEESNTHGVMLVDANKLLSATSSITPGRAGLGFHYTDLCPYVV